MSKLWDPRLTEHHSGMYFYRSNIVLLVLKRVTLWLSCADPEGFVRWGLALTTLLMPPTFKKLKGHIALGLSVRPSVYRLQKFSYSFETSKIDLPSKYSSIAKKPYNFVILGEGSGPTVLLLDPRVTFSDKSFSILAISFRGEDVYGF